MLQLAKIVAFVPTIDPDRARAFYQDVLGLRLVAEDGFAITFDAGGTTLRVTRVPELTPQPFTTLGWWVDDVAAVADALAAHGVELRRYDGLEQDARGLWQPPGGRVVVAWIQDPDGNTLSITGWVGAP